MLWFTYRWVTKLVDEKLVISTGMRRIYKLASALKTKPLKALLSSSRLSLRTLPALGDAVLEA